MRSEDPRAAQLADDPAAYFAEARARRLLAARADVARRLQVERESSRRRPSDGIYSSRPRVEGIHSTSSGDTRRVIVRAVLVVLAAGITAAAVVLGWILVLAGAATL